MCTVSPLNSFPSAIREAHARWLSDHDPHALATVVIAIVAFHLPPGIRAQYSENLPETSRLVEDLGFDSLILAEIIFFIEDLYQVSISNDDLRRIHTVADLRAFVLNKIGPARPPA